MILVLLYFPKYSTYLYADMYWESLEAKFLTFAKPCFLGHNVTTVHCLNYFITFFFWGIRSDILKKFFWQVDKVVGFWWRTLLSRLHRDLKAFGSHAHQLSMISPLVPRNRLLGWKKWGLRNEANCKLSLSCSENTLILVIHYICLTKLTA